MSLVDDVLTMSSTDIDIFLQFTLPVAGDRNGDSLIGATLINDIVRSLPGGKVTIDAEADSASVIGERAQFTVPMLNVVDFPKTNIAAANPVTISAPDLARALSQVVGSASRDTTKQNLTAVQFSSSQSGLQLAATDSYRMAIKDMPDTNLLTFGQSYLIPRKALVEIQRLLDDAETINIRFGEIDITFETPRMQMTTRLINAQFPNVVSFIKPSYAYKFVAAREPLIEALRRSRVLARENTPVRLTMGPQGMRILVQTNDSGTSTEDVDGQMTGGDITAGFNPDYLREGVEAAVGDEVSIEMNDPTQPAVLRGVGDTTFTYLLMPQRVH
jgi:DNA polymerase-3 subunit beta